MSTRCGFIAIVGRPNVGKSTLLNQLLGQKISITSKKPQTTRHRIVGIHTDGDYQTVYVDTPGLHKEEKRAINRLMNRAAASSIGDVEGIIFVVEGNRWTDDDALVLEKLKDVSCPIMLVLNKVDLVSKKEVLLPHIAHLAQQHHFDQIVPISASKGLHLESIQQWVNGLLPESTHLFPEDSITDRSSRFMASEIIREKLMRFTGDELPYATAVEIERYEFDAEAQILRINGLILVERASQKRMVIGAKGDKLKLMGQEARIDMERLFGQRVFLELWVKVKSGWADDERALRSLGYSDEDM